ncbi:NYN domain-containing protein [Alkaliphilus sp. B6464]|uniref:NYN domain-containing protein n=1 Tax=Alkaliphilus sp. B6464 TaxID=2731219 RepID=UPI001BAE2409|nr:NYN domain-containing protein [Alkaliphilus sp. B6464]QUH19859.1 NYN domain-containing protein [Alkaliphilus sp. B6464]
MNEYLILDGYNVINSWPKLKLLMNESLEIARGELIEIMAEYRAFKGVNVIIVFDAYLVKGSTKKSEKLRGVEIVFTKERETADSYIERLIVELSKNRRNRVSVVTNDWTEQQMVLGGGATRVSVREMVLDFDQIKNKINKKIETPRKQKDTLSDRIDPLILEKLEKFRRG